MNTIELFRQSLIDSGKTSKNTVKNYIADVNKFVKWFESKYETDFFPSDLNQKVINLFISENNPLTKEKDLPKVLSNQSNSNSNQDLYSVRSFNRYLSSLRKFASFLYESSLIESNPFSEPAITTPTLLSKPDPWNLKKFREFLYVDGAGSVTSKNYMVDINAFTSWIEYKGYHDLNGSKYIEVIDPLLINEYKRMLAEELGLSESTINRKMSSIRKYLTFGRKTGLLLNETPPTAYIAPTAIAASEPTLPSAISEAALTLPATIGLEELIESAKKEPEPEFQMNYSSFAPLRLAQKLSIPYFLFEDKAAQFFANLVAGKKISLSPSQIKIKTPNWYKRYHNLSFVNYLHVAILIIYATILGSVIYNNFFGIAAKNKTEAAYANPPSIMSFQGRLTDNNGNPITSASNVRFMIYSDPTASGSANVLWQELDQVKPNQNGIFSVLLGNGTSCANFPNGVQTTPCQLPSNLFTNNQKLYLGITVEATPELTPRQQLANVPFAANSQSLQGMSPITTSGGQIANTVLALDSSGNLNMGSGSPTFQATSGEFTLSGQTLVLTTNVGSASNVEIAPDGFGQIDLQSSLINSTSNGHIIPGAVEVDDQFTVLATSSATAAFIVNNDTAGGDIFAASSSGSTQFVIQNNGDVSVQNGAAINTISGGTLSIGNFNATTINIGKAGSTVVFPGYTAQNGVFYADGSGNLSQATSAAPNLCLVSGVANPTWASCSSSGDSAFWSQSNGTLFPNNSTADFLIGGQATDSAKFSVTNVNSGTPTASISGNFIVMPNTSLGNAGGMVGIGVAAPTHTLQLWNDDAVKTATTTWTVVSDFRTKTDVSNFTDGLNIITQINPVSYTYNGLGGTVAGTQGIGVIAQDVQKVAPYMIGEFDAKLHQDDTNTVKLLDFNPHALFFLTINAIKELDSRLTAMSKNFSTDVLSAGSITANSINVATDSVTIAGQSMRDYITQIVSETVNNETIQQWNNGNLISPLASVEQLHTNIISPLADNTPVKLIGNLSVTGNATVSGTFAASSASISGQITSNSIKTNDATVSGTLASESVISNQLSVNSDATISGTLYANNIKADSIEGLDRRILETYHQQAASQAASLIASINNQDSIDLTQPVDIKGITSDFATFKQGLIALGPASFTDATVANSLTIGTTLQITPNSINTVGTDLAIQSLRQGAVDIMAGAFRVETDGSVHVNENAFFAKDVQVNGKLKVENIDPGNNGLVIARNSNSNSSDEANSNPSLDVQGSASISGKLTISKLNLFEAAPAYALSDSEVVATGSAGTDTIKPYQTELTIYNGTVTDKSLIYVSPVGTTSNNTPSLLRQLPGVSFTVGIPVATNVETKFNWIIVN